VTNTPAHLDNWLRDAKERVRGTTLAPVAEQVGRVEAVADELACAAGLVCGKLNRTPACIVRGYSYPTGRGSARDLLRPAGSDLFR